MKMLYIILILLIISGVIFFLNSKKAQANTTDPLPDQVIEAPVVRQVQENHYEGLRNMAFSVTPEQLGLEPSSDELHVYGIIMDWEMNGAIVTTVGFETGDASLYLSTGGGVIGGGKHENVQHACKGLIALAQKHIDRTTSTSSTPLPVHQEVIFYFLTSQGKYSAKESMKNFEDRTSQWLPLFEEVNKVITGLRQSSGG